MHVKQKVNKKMDKISCYLNKLETNGATIWKACGKIKEYTKRSEKKVKKFLYLFFTLRELKIAWI